MWETVRQLKNKILNKKTLKWFYQEKKILVVQLLKFNMAKPH